MRDDVAHHTRTCPDCQRTFELTPGELAFFEALAAGLEGEWKLPRRCTRLPPGYLSSGICTG